MRLVNQSSFNDDSEDLNFNINFVKILGIFNRQKNLIITLTFFISLFSFIFALNKKHIWKGQFQIVISLKL